jgi:hypothetical protein
MARYVVTNLRFDEPTYRELRYRARRRHIPVATMVREAVDQYLARGTSSEIVDPVDQLIGSIPEAAGDESVDHDAYLYGWPKESTRETPGGHERAGGALSPKRRASRGRGSIRAQATERSVRPDRPDPGRSRDDRPDAGGRTTSGRRRS